MSFLNSSNLIFKFFVDVEENAIFEKGACHTTVNLQNCRTSCFSLALFVKLNDMHFLSLLLA